MASQPEPSRRPPAKVRRDPPPAPAALQLTPGAPCPRCHGMVIVRDVVTPEGALTEHLCLGCSRTSHAILERPEVVPRLILTPLCEARLNRVVSAVTRDEVSHRRQSSDGGVDDRADIALSRSALDAVDIRTMFASECQPDGLPWTD